MRYIKKYKLFEAISKFFGYDISRVNDIVDDVTQDLKDEGFIINVSFTKRPMTVRSVQGSYLTSFKILIKKRTDKVYIIPFNWSDVSDRVEQLISTLIEDTQKEYIYSITTRYYDNYRWYGGRSEDGLSEYKTGSKFGGQKFKELTSLEIEFYK